MRRPDLTESFYGGWQVIDATPQEVSDCEYLHTLPRNELLCQLFGGHIWA